LIKKSSKEKDMIPESLIKELSQPGETKLVLLVLDGLGGLPIDGLTEMEKANTPNLDDLTKRSICGLTDSVSIGVTPGSGPGHLGLFGYDPLKYEIGRGVLEALGQGLILSPNDLASRGNFATKDKNGIIVDRRAGRIPTEENKKLIAFLRENISKIDNVEIILDSGREHRFVAIFRSKNLEADIKDADPQKEGLPAVPAYPLSDGSKYAADIINRFIEKVNELLSNQKKANTILMRGFAKLPKIPSMKELFKIKPAAIATYPMYRGLARLVGMEILETGETIKDEFDTLKDNFDKYDFFFVHIKKTDSFGEDGNFPKKVEIIEEVDRLIPTLLELKPDVLVITGDHSTPSILKSHSWHPNPILLYSRYERVDDVKHFSEREFAKGGLGRFLAQNILLLMLANGLGLKKFGA